MAKGFVVKAKFPSKKNSFDKWKEDLIKDIRFYDHRDDLDWNTGEFSEISSRDISVYHPIYNYQITQSPCNLISIQTKFLEIKDDCKCILEIGVDCNLTKTQMTSTNIFLNNKNDETLYIGIDIDDKSYIDNEEKNIFTLRTDSSNTEDVMNFIRSKGVDQIDFLFIDGWHSINQVIKEWEYTRYLSDFGVVGFHDTAIHPGPHLFLKYLNRDKWNVIENSCSEYSNDYGVGFAWKNYNKY